MGNGVKKLITGNTVITPDHGSGIIALLDPKSSRAKVYFRQGPPAKWYDLAALSRVDLEPQMQQEHNVMLDTAPGGELPEEAAGLPITDGWDVDANKAKVVG